MSGDSDTAAQIQKHSTLDDKSEKRVFVGYDVRSKGYKHYNPITKKRMVSRDVVFDEKHHGIEMTN
ncbi:copia-type polyprotein [Cucumis melo var. makuwa]|uniref:Copia-type polyprotein n=1 Tax=Cucumis melo var. makuwa TaxID=1194695 RepID=A0A5D3D525_CUCMM|nr:copia-type polyprotein [Cucumis melo var. makuwa]